MKVQFPIYSDLKSLLEKISTCYVNPKNSSTTKINKHTTSGYSLFTHCSFDAAKNKLDYYRGLYFIKMLCKDLKEHATKIINYEKRERIPLTYGKNESYIKEEVCHVCRNIYYRY